MRRRLLEAFTAAVAGGLVLGLGSCSDDAGPAPERDPAAAASAAIDDRARQPHERTDLPTANGAGDVSGDAASEGDADGADGAVSGDSAGASSSDSASAEDDTPARAVVPSGEVIAHYNLDIDDCFDRVEHLVSGRKRATTTRLSCSVPHMYQVFSLLDYPSDATVYPGDSAMEDFALQSCYPLFEHWADSAYETSALEIEVLTPNLEDFTDATYPYRGIHCLVRRDDGERLVGTARSAGL